MSHSFNELLPKINRIKQKITEHNIQLNACLSQEEVANFESLHNILFPEAYRQFLLLVGDGGDGPPYYGLVPLAETLTGSASTKLVRENSGRLVDDWTQFRPDLPFPLTDTWDWEYESESQERNDEETDEIVLAMHEHGHLYLGTEGCGEDWILIVTGSESGNVWNRAESFTRPCVPRLDFLSWYEYWLDHGIQNLDTFSWEICLPLPSWWGSFYATS